MHEPAPPSRGVRPDEPSGSERLDSWKEIAAYLSRDVTTVQRWEKSEGMPVHRHAHRKLGSVYAFRSELDAWWRARSTGREDSEVGEAAPASDTDSPRIPIRHVRKVPAWLVWAGPAVLVLLLGAAFLLSGRPGKAARPAPQFIAVLPFENLSGDSSQDFFADGLTDALITHLSGLHGLKVVSRTSVRQFKGTREPLPRIAQQLGVDTVIEGSVQPASDRAVIRVQLIDAASDTHLWARDFNRPLGDMLTLQAEVARTVAEQVHGELSADESLRLAGAGTVDPAAYQEYLLGRSDLWQFDKDDVESAIGHFERATTIDAGYASAYAGLAYAWWVRGVFGQIGLSEAEAPARLAARRALELDDQLADAYAVQGYLECIYDHDWTGAERTIRRALELDPNNVGAHYTYALLLMALGRFDESVAQIALAAERDPFSAQIQSTFGRVLYRARRYPEAVTRLRRAIALDPSNATAHGRLGDVYEQLGSFPEAIAEFETASRLAGVSVDPSLARVYAHMGRVGEAEDILRALQNEPGREAMAAAGAYAAMGRPDEAFEILFRIIDSRRRLAIFFTQDPTLEPLRADRRWPQLLSRLNLPQ